MKEFIYRNRVLVLIAIVLFVVYAIEKIFSIDLLSNRGVLLMFAYALYGDLRDRIIDLEERLYE